MIFTLSKIDCGQWKTQLLYITQRESFRRKMTQFQQNKAAASFRGRKN